MRLERETIFDAAKSTLLPTVRVRPEPDKMASHTDSKFGGAYYLPEEAEDPGMELLAQINLSQVPRLEGFPETGLLQFFIRSDAETFERFLEDGPVWLSNSGFFQVRYYPEVSENTPAHENDVPEERWGMNAVAGGMKFEAEEEIATISFGEEGGLAIDLGFESLANVLMPVFQAAWDADEDDEDEEDDDADEEDEDAEGVYDLTLCSDTDQFARDFGNWGFKLGGHPALRQGEFRLDHDAYAAHSILLFQYDLTVPDPDDPMDLEKDTFGFFIRPEDLKARRFDDILMTHHNCY